MINSKVLVIPDIHGRNFWRKPIKDIDKFDEVIFLGDYLDPYPNEYKDSSESMEPDLVQILIDIIQLKKNHSDKVTLLTGNHTDHYIWPKQVITSSRFDRSNCEKYHKIFQGNLDCFTFAHTKGKVVFSHAGITEGWAQRVYEDMGFPDDAYDFWDVVDCIADVPLSDINSIYLDLISEVSRHRGGDMFWGSCEWADLIEHTKSYKEGEKLTWEDYYPYYQVFGHTQLKSPIITKELACLNCRKAFIVNIWTHKVEEYK